MKTYFFVFSLGALVLLPAQAAESETIYLNRRGGFDWCAAGVSGMVSAQWDNWKHSASSVNAATFDGAYDLMRSQEIYARGTWSGGDVEATAQSAGGARIENSMTIKKDLRDVNCLGTRILFKYDIWCGAAWQNSEGARGTFPRNRTRKGLFTGEISSLTLTSTNGVVVVIQMPRKASIHISNDSAWCDAYSVRFVHRGNFLAGDALSDTFTLGRPGRMVRYGGAYSLTAKASDTWLPMFLRKQPVRGGVLDFSAMGLADGPCGKYGRLVRVRDHFEFEKRPGEHVHFAGSNILGSCCIFDTEAEMDEMVERILASGYNTMRLHHIDCVAGILKRKTDPSEAILDPERLDKLDRFVAKCYARGIYLTIDLFSLRPFSWKSMGIDRKGDMHFQLAKAFVHLTDAGFESWKRYAAALLNHVNPHTGRAWKDEPGLPLVCLVNEAGISQSWKWIRECPEIFSKLGYPPDELLKLRKSNCPEFDILCDRVERASFARMHAFVKSLGLKALVTDLNNGPHPEVKNAFRAEKLDYFDNHFYYDHPQWLGERLKLPARQKMAEIREYEEGKICKKPPALACSKRDLPNMPYTVTEWNFNAPNPVRSGAGLYLGALAATEDWDGLWRFTWAHARGSLYEQDNRIGFFDVMRDPIMFLNDRTFVALYLRGDGKGTMVESPASAPRHSFAVNAPRTQGVYLSAAGRLETSHLSVTSDGRCTVAATGLDGAAPLGSARRILVTYLTDCINEGMTWIDENRGIISSFGKGSILVQVGTANVTLKLDPNLAYTVWACDTNGARRSKIAAQRTAAGSLTFEMAIRKGSPATMVYEVVAGNYSSTDNR